DNADVRGWAHEMTAWFALTAGNYPGVILAARAGTEIARQHGVAVQLAAQEAKAWARMGDRRQVELALERGRALLEQLEHPTNLDNHFVVDPAKYDFYAMDCYRIVGADALAESYANAAIRAGTGLIGAERSSIRIAEAQVTVGVVAARSGDPDGAVELGERTLAGDRKSLPSLLMVSAELSTLLEQHHGAATEVRDYLDHLRAL